MPASCSSSPSSTDPHDDVGDVASLSAPGQTQVSIIILMFTLRRNYPFSRTRRDADEEDLAKNNDEEEEEEEFKWRTRTEEG